MIIQTVNATRSDIDWIAVELRSEASTALLKATGARPDHPAEVLIGDFLKMELDGPDLELTKDPFSVAITNPPYVIAEAIIKHARLMSDWVVMLLRTNFLGSTKRAEWLRQDMPDVYQLAHRPSFRPDGKTDSIEYSWFVWPPERRQVGKISVLPPVDPLLRGRRARRRAAPR